MLYKREQFITTYLTIENPDGDGISLSELSFEDQLKVLAEARDSALALGKQASASKRVLKAQIIELLSHDVPANEVLEYVKTVQKVSGQSWSVIRMWADDNAVSDQIRQAIDMAFHERRLDSKQRRLR